MLTEYQEWLKSKIDVVHTSGFDVQQPAPKNGNGTKEIDYAGQTI